MRFFILPIIATLLYSCAATKKTTTNIHPEAAGQPAQSNYDNMLADAGTTFTASGVNPVNWYVKINYDDKLNFLADDGLQLNVAFSTLKQQQQQQSAYTFSGSSKAGDIIITVKDGDCSIPTAKKMYKKAVSISINKKLYEGCGAFVNDADLNGKWILEKIGNDKIVTADYNKLPELQFDLSKNIVGGNDGCNRVSGTMEVQGKRIQFGALAGTKMACNKKDISKIIGSLVSGKLVDYHFKDNKLVLYLPDDSILTFIKSVSK